jgi:tetratricopeptide (TPR) repeat protein
MARQPSFLALAVLVLLSLFVTTGVASAQSSEAIAAEQNCLNASKQGDNAAAVSVCTQALSLAPNNALVAAIVCDGQSGLGNYDAAVTSCTQAITLNATSETAYVNRCNAYMMLGNFANAISDCNQAVTLNPKDQDVYIDLGAIYLKQQNFAAGITELNKAIALAPNSAAALVNRGIANFELGNKQAALADFQSVLKIDPTNATALKGMQALGQPVAAPPTPTPAASQNQISICNDFPVTIYVAFAVESQGHFTAGGWWNVDPKKCEPANFNFGGAATLYYAADSDSYKKGNSNTTEHWGAKQSLYVSDQKFNFTDAQQNRTGAHAEQFDLLALTPDQQASTLAVTFHFANNLPTTINIKATKP